MSALNVDRIDHLVLTVADVEATVAFYERVLGLRGVTFEPGRRGLVVGDQRINLHATGAEFLPHARRPTPGSGDLCLITRTPVADVLAALTAAGVAVEEGPVARTGALGAMVSVYFRDPDGNLIEVARYD